jgi:hypothetical protein
MARMMVLVMAGIGAFQLRRRGADVVAVAVPDYLEPPVGLRSGSMNAESCVRISASESRDLVEASARHRPEQHDLQHSVQRVQPGR